MKMSSRSANASMWWRTNESTWHSGSTINPNVRGFVAENIELGGPQVVARDGPRVVGWCDIVPWWHHTLRHCGALGMGSLAGYRGRGLGNVFLGAGLERAVQARVTRVELKAREDNLRALAL